MGKIAAGLHLGAAILLCTGCATTPGTDGQLWWLLHQGQRIAQLVPLGPPDPQLEAAGATRPAAFVHPLLAPGGTPLTELYPDDHIHHRGLFWAWHQITINGVQRADGWLLTGMTFAPVSATLSRDRRHGTMITDWVVDGRAILRETATIVARRDGLDVAVTFQAQVAGLALGGGADDKGYGGISLRLRDAERLRFSSDGTVVTAQRQAIDAGTGMRFAWDAPFPGAPRAVSMRCTVDGKPVTRWILRREKSMQNCVWPGATPVPVDIERPIRLTASIRFER